MSMDDIKSVFESHAVVADSRSAVARHHLDGMASHLAFTRNAWKFTGRLLAAIFCCLFLLVGQQSLSMAQTQDGHWVVSYQTVGTAFGGGYPIPYYAVSLFNTPGVEVPTPVVGATTVNGGFTDGGFISCSALSANLAGYPQSSSAFADGYGASKVFIVVTWQPKNNDYANDPPPPLVMIGYKCTASVQTKTWVSFQYGDDPTIGVSTAQASVSFGDVLASTESDTEMPYFPPFYEYDEDPETQTKTDAKYTYVLLQVTNGQASKEIDASWSSYAEGDCPADQDLAGGCSGEATFSYTLDVDIAGKDAGRANSLLGTWWDGIKKWTASDPSFTRWQPLAFAPSISSQPFLIVPPGSPNLTESLPPYWGNLNCLYSIAIYPESNPDHNGTGNYYEPPQISDQIFEDTQTNTGGYVIIDANGDRLTLDKNFVQSPDILSTFAQSGSGFTLSNAGPPGHLRERGNYTYTFQLNPAGDLVTAKLLSIADDLGNVQNLSYGNNTPTSPFLTVTDVTSNRQLYFYLQGNYVHKVVAPVLFGTVPVITTILGNDGGGHFTTISTYNGSDTNYLNPITQSQYSYNGDSPVHINQGLSTQTISYINSPDLDVVGRAIPRVNNVTIGSLTDPTNAAQSIIHYSYGTVNEGYGFFGIDSRTNTVTDPNGNLTQLIYNYVEPITSADPEAIAFVQTTGPTFTGASGPNVTRESWLPDRSHPTSYRVTDPADRSWSASYDGTTGLPTQLQDPAANVTQLSYSGLDLQSILDPTGVQWSFGYDPAHPNDGLLTSITDNAQNVVMTATYNQYGQMLTQTVPAAVSASGTDETTTNTYDEVTPTGDLLSVTDPLGAVSLVGRIDPISRTLIPGSAYDALGDALAFTVFPDTGNPATAQQALVTQFSWTADQQGQSVILPNGLTLSHAYTNGVKTQTQMLDPSSNVLAQVNASFDTHGRLSHSSDLLGITAQLSYDPNGNAVSVTDARGIGVSANYGPNNEVTSLSGPFGNHTFSYGAAGDLAQFTDSRNDVFAYGYDGIGRLQTIGVAGQSDENLTYAYDIVGRLVSVTKGNGDSVVYAYNTPNKWVSSVVTTVGGRATTINYTYYSDGKRRQMAVSAANYFNYTTGYEWNAAGHLIGMDTPDGGHTGWTYDAVGRSTGQSTNTGHSVLSTQLTYGGSGMPGDLSTAPAYLRQYGNSINGAAFDNITLTHSYLDQLLGYSHSQSNGNSETAGYTYDSRGRLTGESHQGIASGQTFSSTAHYTYDASNNLNAGANGWQYDGQNRLTASPPNPGGIPGAEQVLYDADGHATTVKTPKTYNADGTVASTDIQTITYNVWGQIASITDQTGAGNGGLPVPACSTTTPAKSAGSHGSSRTLSTPPIGGPISPGGTPTTNYVATYTYDPLGRLACQSVVAGLQTTTTLYDYDGGTLIGEQSFTIYQAILRLSSGGLSPTRTSGRSDIVNRLQSRSGGENSAAPSASGFAPYALSPERILSNGIDTASTSQASVGDPDMLWASPFAQRQHAARDSLGGDSGEDAVANASADRADLNRSLLFTTPESPVGVSTSGTDAFGALASVVGSADEATTAVGSANSSLLTGILNQTAIGVGTGIPIGSYTTHSSGPLGHFGSWVLPTNNNNNTAGPWYQTFYDITGVAVAVVDGSGNVQWSANRGSDAFANPYTYIGTSGCSIVPGAPAPQFPTRNGYQSAATINAANGGQNAPYSPALARTLTAEDSPDADLEGRDGSLGASEAGFLNDGFANLMASPAFQPGSEGRRFSAGAVRAIPIAGQVYSLDALLSGYDPIAGTCESNGDRIADTLNLVTPLVEGAGEEEAFDPNTVKGKSLALGLTKTRTGGLEPWRAMAYVLKKEGKSVEQIGNMNRMAKTMEHVDEIHFNLMGTDTKFLLGDPNKGFPALEWQHILQTPELWNKTTVYHAPADLYLPPGVIRSDENVHRFGF